LRARGLATMPQYCLEKRLWPTVVHEVGEYALHGLLHFVLATSVLLPNNPSTNGFAMHW
jgi:hypothetical protein